MQASLSATPAALTVEVDPEWIQAGNRPPQPITRDMADILAGALASDLRRIIGDEVINAGLVVPAALYDLTELLRPGLPIAEMMLDVYRGSLRHGEFEASLLALGTAGGRFPVPELAPARRPGSGPLLAIPWALVAPSTNLDRIRQRLEEDLLGKGSASLEMDRVVRQQFGLEPIHLTYATFHDLSALMRVQLEYAGFGGLWRLIEAALYRPEEPTGVELSTGNAFVTVQGRVWTPALGFAAWAAHSASELEPALGYAEHVGVQRQYTAGLAAHGLEIRPVALSPTGFEARPRDTLTAVTAAELADFDRYTDIVSGDPAAFSAASLTLTEHLEPSMGPLAYTAHASSASGETTLLAHDYPLHPEAIPRLREEWQRRAHQAGASFHVHEPGAVLVGNEPPGLGSGTR